MSKAAIAQVIPAANLRFHEALDDIEMEIVSRIHLLLRFLLLNSSQLRAKSVFERDLSSIRAKRAERERAAAGILKARSPKAITKNVSSKGSPQEDLKKSQLPTPAEGQPSTEAAAGDDNLDISMMDGPASPAKPNGLPDYADTTATDAIKTEPFTLPQELPKDPEQPKGLAISLAQEPATTTKPDPETTDITPGQLPKEEAPTPKDNSSLEDTADFDSMFNDPDATDEIDFDLAFPSTDDAQHDPIPPPNTIRDLTSTNDNNNFLDDSAFENISLAPATEQQNAANVGTGGDEEDISSLLPGLENYVNGTGHDFSASIADMVSSIPLNPNAELKTSLGMGMGIGQGNSSQPQQLSSETDGMDGSNG
ncbi:MAG: hypothetical protein Q9218_004604, partial [Villophora microphyllina]